MADGGLHHVTGPGAKEILVSLNVLVVGAIAFFGARKGIAASLKARTEGVTKKLRESKDELQRVEAALASAKKQLGAFESTKQKMVDEVRREGEVLTRNFLEEATVSANRILSDARLAAQDEARSAAQNLKKKLVEEAVHQAFTLISKSAEQQKNVHKQFLENFSEGVKGGTNGR
jgi:F0F1-type ATP synthase membrane subunit b/b'